MRPFIACVFVLFSINLTACAQPAATQLRILPQDCRVPAGQQTSLSLDGIIPQNAAIQWQTSQGSIISSGLNVSAVFTAPSIPGDVSVTALVDTGTPNPPITRVCHVVDAPVSPTTVNQPTQAIPANTPAQPTMAGPEKTIIISEVMGNPCGNDDVKKWNQYVELYNYGDQPVDVGGWYLADANSTAPDQLVSWNTRNAATTLAGIPVANTTIIPPHGVAVVLSPIYPNGLNDANMPYRFPSTTIILTVAEGDRIGDDILGLQSYDGGRDVLVLYIGGSAVINQVVSTYGSPILDVYPQNLRDDRKDLIPYDLRECSSAERTEPQAADLTASWRQVLNGSPGEVPYP